MNRYRVVYKATEEVVVSGFHSRAQARAKKKDLEQVEQVRDGSTKRPSAYYVETSDEHPSGAGIYLH